MKRLDVSDQMTSIQDREDLCPDVNAPRSLVPEGTEDHAAQGSKHQTKATDESTNAERL